MIIREGKLESNPIGIYEDAIVRQASFEVQMAQDVQAIMDEATYKRRRRGALLALCTPEAIADRKALYDATFAAATEAGLQLKKQIRAELGLPDDDPPLPDPLPKEMKGQSESTIRAMLRHENWEWDKTLQVWKQK